MNIMDTMNTMDIKKWADKKYEEQKETVNYYIKEGMDKIVAVKMVLKNSTIGKGYKIQLRKDFGLSIFD